MGAKRFYQTLFLIVASYKLLITPLVSADLFVWVDNGLRILEAGAVPRVDQASFTASGFFLYPSHLSSLLLALVYKAGGIFSLFAVLRGIHFFVIYRLYTRVFKENLHNLPNFLISVASVVGVQMMLDRPAVLVLPLAIWMMEKILSKEKEEPVFRSYSVFLVSVLWTNLHPSSLLLPLFFGYRFVLSLVNGRPVGEDLKLVFLVTLGICLNPIHFHIFSYAVETAMASKQRIIDEWSSPFSFKFPNYSFLFFGSALFTLWRLRQKASLKKYLLSSEFFFLVLALTSIRQTIWYFLIMGGVFKKYGLWRDGCPKTVSPLRNKVVLAGFALLAPALFLHNLTYNRLFDLNAPYELLEKIPDRPGCRIFNEHDGGFFSVFLSNCQVFLDSRNIIYPDKVVKDFFEISGGQNTIQLLEEYSINVVTLYSNNEKTAKILSDSAQWETVFKNESSTLFVRQ